MKPVTHTRRTETWSLIRILLAALVGLMIAAATVRGTRPPNLDSPGDFERLKPTTVDATIERADRESSVVPLERPSGSSSDYPNDEASPYRFEETMPSPYDIWLDTRLLAAVSRVV